MKKTLMSLSLLLIVVLTLTGCYEWPDPIWNPDDSGLPTPTISSVDVTELLGGIDNITITGSGFGTVADEVLVYFKKGAMVGRGRTLSTTDTELIVEAPATYSDSLEIWIDRRGCFEYAKDTTNLITISKGMNTLPITPPSALNKIAVDNGNILVAYGTSMDMLHVSDIDTVTTFSGVSFAATQPVLSLKMKGSDVYYTLSYYMVKYDGSVNRVKINSDKYPSYDFSFANNDRVYMTGLNNIYSMHHDLSNPTSALEDLDYDYKKCEVYDSKLYVSAIYTGDDTLRTNEKLILAYPINTDGSLGTGETIINWTEDFAGSEIVDIVFDTEGKMYVATKTRTPIYVIEPAAGSYADGSVKLLYPVLLKNTIFSMSWESGSYMAIITEGTDGSRTAYRLKMKETPSTSYLP